MKRFLLSLLVLTMSMVAVAQPGTIVDRSSLDYPPAGYVNGLFTVNEQGTQVFFSQGNLQYTDGEWRFAEHQWEFLGDNGQGSDAEDAARDLLGWGTSGYDHGAVSYQPWATSQETSDYYAYGSPEYNLFDETGQADWGGNGIANGGNVEGLWRVLTREEWDYLFHSRATSSGVRFAKGKVNKVCGVILLPDDWEASWYALANANNAGGKYKDNNITQADWENVLEAHGAVFLPAAGYRFGTRLYYLGKRGSYYSATSIGSLHVWDMYFDDTHLGASASVTRRSNGMSVRLVATSTALWYTEVTTGEVTDITSNSATAAGTVVTAGGTLLTAVGVCWSTSPDPTVDGDHTDEGVLTGDFTSLLTGLERNTTYYLRAYATDGEGDTMYGDEVTFTTLPELPAVTTAAVTEIGITTATAGGEVTDDGGTVVDECGVCWSTGAEPDLEGNHIAAATPGMGAFTVALTGLTQATTYYVRAYVTNSEGTVYGEVVTFTTLPQPYDITVSANPAEGGMVSGGGTINQGDLCELTATPNEGYDFVNWTEGVDATGAPQVVSTESTYSFDVTGDRILVANFQLKTYEVNVSVNPEEGGSIKVDGEVFISGNIDHGTALTLVAEPAEGYAFVNWTEGDTEVSTDAEYTFDVFGPHTLVANFQLKTYQIAVSVDPEEGGSVKVDGAVFTSGDIDHGTNLTLVAEPAEGYAFVNWTEGVDVTGAPNVVSTDASYSLNVTGTHTLVAHFELTLPEGALKGVFSVRNNYKIHFSQGNLQYIGSAATPYWKFADHQWDFFAKTTGQNSDAQNVDRDLFSWATSGYAHGGACYQPWSVSGKTKDHYAYGNKNYRLFDQTGQADWGYNAISNGGNTENSGWRTLSYEEWDYLFNTRSTTSGILYAKAVVNNVNGVILLPDDWSEGYYTLNSTNTSNTNYDSNNISLEDWGTLEHYGAVFLPAAGIRNGTSYSDVNQGLYWSATRSHYVRISNGTLDVTGGGSLLNGRSVRLVRPIQEYSFTINASANPTAEGTVSGADTYVEGTQCTVAAIPNTGYFFTNWTEGVDDSGAPKVVSTEQFYTFRVMENHNLVAHFEAVPDGAIGGAFSVRKGYQVLFSQGNLQYIGSAAAPYWKFAENQLDYLGDNGQGSESQTVDRDLFGWGTSGWDNGNTYYQPWSTGRVNDASQTFGYGPTDGTSYEYDLTGAYGNADWGHNAISNGGDTPDQWRTLTQKEWAYLFNTRVTPSGVRYAKANVNNVNGVILLPDDWNTDYYTLNDANTTGASFDSNTITDTQWATMEQHGAVFLPAAGYRFGTLVGSDGSYGNYWSASYGISPYAYSEYFDESKLYTNNNSSRNNGYSVRLIRPAGIHSFEVSVSDNPNLSGTVSGSGTYDEGAECTITATPDAGYTFINWTEVGDGTETPKVFSTSPTCTFRVMDNHNLVANFVKGAILGAFSVRDNYKVFFSQGNLQYQASTSTWRFALNQWDYVGTQSPGIGSAGGTVTGSDNSNISDSYNGWIDLFGWGTSGFEHGAVCYQPWSTSQTESDYYAYGSDSYHLFDQTGQADWGFNEISNGGNWSVSNQWWRALTLEEWYYLFNSRNTTNNIRYAKAKVNGVNGVILLPDDWNATYYALSNTNTANAPFSDNTINSTDWSTLEQHGAVFLPAAGYRLGTLVNNVGGCGFYWTASYKNSNSASLLFFGDDGLVSSDNMRSSGQSVRLVHPIKDYFFDIKVSANPSEGGTVSGQGSYKEGTQCTVTAKPNPGYVFVNWTRGGKQVSTSATYTFLVTGNRTLKANFEALPEGAINGKFSINAEGAKVYFSQGNLQYQASTTTWRFADNQWNYVGSDNSNISSTYDGWIDLFGWGTSGYDHGAVCYQPWSISESYSHYYAYGEYDNHLFDQTGQADWGYNAISNGGDTPNQWRTLTKYEWVYLFDTRPGLRYAKANVNNVNGVILLPDDWNTEYYTFNNYNTPDVSFNSNTITDTQWSTLEQHGAVFLPAAGRRYGTSVFSVDSYGLYWSASYGDSDNAWNVYFNDSYLYTDDDNGRDNGFSVRLVRSVE